MSKSARLNASCRPTTTSGGGVAGIFDEHAARDCAGCADAGSGAARAAIRSAQQTTARMIHSL